MMEFNISWKGNIFSCLLLIVLVNFVHQSDSKYVYQEKFIEVPLDHFNYATNKTFQLRYLINDTFAAKNRKTSILFYTGNEGDIELFAENTGFQWELADALSAIVVFAEHRFYGKSLPFGNASFDSPAHSGYLTIEQALADYAQLIDTITNGKNNKPVIAIGGSYGGMLAAWFRMKYPHHVVGALAASAPIWQFQDITPCNIFTRIISAVFQTSYGENCTVNIRKSWDVLRNFASNDTGRAFLNKNFKFCKNLSKPEDINKFFDYLEDVYGNLAMANYPYESDFLAPLPAYPVRQFCFNLQKDYTANDTALLLAMQSALSVYTNFTGKVNCLDYQSAFDPSLGGQAWDVQTCNEIVMPMCSGGDNDMFMKKDWNPKDYSDKCFAKFQIRPRPREILIRFGGTKINSASNIIFSNGLLDPWSGGGVLKTPNSKINIIIIPEGAHHLDLRAANPKDPDSIREARKMEASIIKSWIKEYYAA